MKQFDEKALNSVKIAAILLAAVVFGGLVGWYGTSEFVMEGAKHRNETVCECGDTGVRAASGVKRRDISDARVGPYRSRAVRVVGVGPDGRYATESVSVDDARRGLCDTLHKAALRKSGKAPLEERYARTRRGGVFGRGGHDDKDGPIIYPDDIYIDGIPMVDQGKKAYCAAAAAARVLQGYGIEITMEDLVSLAGSSETKGTSVVNWEKALAQVANEHGLRLRTVRELTETCTPFSKQLYNYNNMAELMGCSGVDTSDYLQPGVEDRKSFWEDRKYAVQRNVMLGDDRKCAAFEENVIGRIDESDPIFWRVTTGDISEQRVDTSENKVRYYERESHMRLIVGYNEVRGEVIYSDSWGEGHAHKRMDAQDALSITTGMYYLAD